MTSCGQDYVYRIDGKLSNLEDEVIYVVYEREDYKLVDTVFCEKPGQFTVFQQQEGFHTATIYFNEKADQVTAYLTPQQKVTISGDADSPLLIQVKGGKINDRLNDFSKTISPLLKELSELNRQFTQRQNRTMDEADIITQMANIDIQLKEQAKLFITESPDEEASVVLIGNYFAEPEDTRKMDELLAMLDPELKSFFLTRELEQYSMRAKRTAIGAEAPGFALKDIYGNSFSLDSFPDRYLLLTFTAPWCDMCQTEDLYLDQVVSNYPKEKVDVLLISLDDKQQAVREVLANDTIQWNLVTDSAGQATMMLDLYNVSALPRSFLIDEEGRIIMKTENGIEIKQTLEKLFAE